MKQKTVMVKLIRHAILALGKGSNTCKLLKRTFSSMSQNASVFSHWSCLYTMHLQKQRKVFEVGGSTNDGACISTCPLGGSGGVLPQKFFKTRCSEIASEAIFVLKSRQFLPWTCLVLLCDKIAPESLSHHCTYSSYTQCGSKGVKKVTIPDSLKGGGGVLKGKFLPRGGTCPWCPPPPPWFRHLWPYVWKA